MNPYNYQQHPNLINLIKHLKFIKEYDTFFYSSKDNRHVLYSIDHLVCFDHYEPKIKETHIRAHSHMKLEFKEDIFISLIINDETQCFLTHSDAISHFIICNMFKNRIDDVLKTYHLKSFHKYEFLRNKCLTCGYNPNFERMMISLGDKCICAACCIFADDFIKNLQRKFFLLLQLTLKEHARVILKLWLKNDLYDSFSDRF